MRKSCRHFAIKMVKWSHLEDLIICVAKLVVQKSWGPLICAEARVVSIASQNSLRSASLFWPISELKMVRKSLKFRVSEHFVLRLHFELQIWWFPGGPMAENHWFYQVKTRFFVKPRFLQLGRFFIDFRPLNCFKIYESLLPDAIVFSTSFSKWILMILGSDLEVQKPLNFKKITTLGGPW